jgi:hypothetical protein
MLGAAAPSAKGAVAAAPARRRSLERNEWDVEIVRLYPIER